METAIIVAIIAGASTVLGNSLLKWSEARDRITWENRKQKIRVYEQCLSAIGEMVRQSDTGSEPSSSFAPAHVTPDMFNWASPQAFLNYFLLRIELQKTGDARPDFKSLLSSLGNLIWTIRHDLGYKDKKWDDDVRDGIGVIFLRDTMGSKQDSPWTRMRKAMASRPSRH